MPGPMPPRSSAGSSTPAKGPGTSSDLETWVPVEAWHRALDLLHEASHLLHDAARPAGTPDTIHVSFTSNAFTMSGGLTGEAVRRTPSKETTR